MAIVLTGVIALFVAPAPAAAVSVQQAIRSTVFIVTYQSLYGETVIVGRASGVIVSSDGLVVTNKHAVLSDELNNTVYEVAIFPTGSNEEPDTDCMWIPSEVFTVSNLDLAILEPPATLPCGVPSYLNPVDYIPETGTQIQVVGYPALSFGGGSITLTRGQISGKADDYLKTDAKLSEGNSGGPVVDDAGRFIGIATAITQEEIGLIIPISRIYKNITERSSLPSYKPAQQPDYNYSGRCPENEYDVANVCVCKPGLRRDSNRRCVDFSCPLGSHAVGMKCECNPGYTLNERGSCVPEKQKSTPRGGFDTNNPTEARPEDYEICTHADCRTCLNYRPKSECPSYHTAVSFAGLVLSTLESDSSKVACLVIQESAIPSTRDLRDMDWDYGYLDDRAANMVYKMLLSQLQGKKKEYCSAANKENTRIVSPQQESSSLKNYVQVIPGDQSITLKWRILYPKKYNSNYKYVYNVQWRKAGNSAFHINRTENSQFTISNLENCSEYEIKVATPWPEGDVPIYFGTPSPPGGCNNYDSANISSSFVDVPTDFFVYDEIMTLRDMGVISGYPDGTFKPDNTVNRAELLKMLIGGLHSHELRDETHCFPDVREQWFAQYVCAAKRLGWVSGYPDGTFRPANMLNRAEAIKIIVSSVTNDFSSDEQLHYDVKESDWFAPYTRKAFELGIETSRSLFKPSADLYRFDAAIWIYNAIIDTDS